jgi:ribosomal protein L37AE/L43A
MLAKGITPEQFIETLNEAEIKVITCPVCKKITSVEPLSDTEWLCYECGNIWRVE